MIPKTIHYCWFGRNPLPPLAIKCIASWKKYFPDYIIKEWNENNFDVNIIPYTKEAYLQKKYAFVSDYARFWILYNQGGIYFDVSVEIIKPMNDIIVKGSFMGMEYDKINPGLGMACVPKHSIYKEVLDLYSTLFFRYNNGHLNYTTVVRYTTSVFQKYGLKECNIIQTIEGIYIYPTEYFCPKDWKTNKQEITLNTYSIHHFRGSWLPPLKKLRLKIRHFFHLSDGSIIVRLYKMLNDENK
jgi:mannosyltransferase OCH1-like enzyme